MGNTATITSLATLPDVRRAVGRSRSAETYRAGRLIYSDFTDSSLDAALFTMTGFSRVTDGSTNAIQNTVSNAQATLTTLISDFKDFDLRIKYRQVNDVNYGSTRAPSIFGRNVPGLGNYYLSNRMGATGANFSEVTAQNSPATVQYMQDANPSDTANYRYLRMQVTGAIARIKTWIAGSDEPDWNCAGALTSDASTGGVIPWQGSLGISSLYNTCFISEFRAVELLRSDENLLRNAQAEIGVARDDSGNIAGTALNIWDNNSQDGTFSVESVLDRDGILRPAFKVYRASALGTESGLFNQTVVSLDGDVVYGGARQFHNQQAAFIYGKNLELSVWSKAQNLVSPNPPKLGGAMVLYEFDQGGIPIQSGGNYYSALNPTAKTGGIVLEQASGQGTWDWNETRFQVPVYPGAVHFVFSMGMHDVEMTGTLWLQDPVMRVVS